MLRLIPAPAHRLALRIGYRLRGVWRRVVRPHSSGVCMVAVDDGQVLLVRHSYGHRRWTLPSGGLKSGEDPAETARREFAEELGGDLADLASVGSSVVTLMGAPDTVHLFRGKPSGAIRIDGREIVAAQWFAADALPPETSSTTRRCIAAALET